MFFVVKAVVIVNGILHEVILEWVPSLIYVSYVEPSTSLAMHIHDQVEEQLEYFKGVLNTFTGIHVTDYFENSKDPEEFK